MKVSTKKLENIHSKKEQISYGLKFLDIKVLNHQNFIFRS